RGEGCRSEVTSRIPRARGRPRSAQAEPGPRPDQLHEGLAWLEADGSFDLEHQRRAGFALEVESVGDAPAVEQVVARAPEVGWQAFGSLDAARPQLIGRNGSGALDDARVRRLEPPLDGAVPTAIGAEPELRVVGMHAHALQFPAGRERRDARD